MVLGDCTIFLFWRVLGCSWLVFICLCVFGVVEMCHFLYKNITRVRWVPSIERVGVCGNVMWCCAHCGLFGWGVLFC